jgi:putative heme-binding domain-containing protein
MSRLRFALLALSPCLLVSLSPSPLVSPCFSGPQPATTAPAEKPLKTKDGKILPSMEELAKLAGDAKAGAVVFRNVKAANCIKCHEIGNEGQMIGPPLTVIGGKLNKGQLYEAILYPSAAIEMGYEAWIVKTKKGDVWAGLKVEDTPDRITIKDTDGKYHDVDRDDIVRMAKQPLSLMPEALNETMTQQDLVNLVEYLASLKS